MVVLSEEETVQQTLVDASDPVMSFANRTLESGDDPDDYEWERTAFRNRSAVIDDWYKPGAIINPSSRTLTAGYFLYLQSRWYLRDGENARRILWDESDKLEGIPSEDGRFAFLFNHWGSRMANSLLRKNAIGATFKGDTADEYDGLMSHASAGVQKFVVPQVSDKPSMKGIPKATQEMMQKVAKSLIVAIDPEKRPDGKKTTSIALMKDGKKEKLDPFTAYYLMRYLSPYLANEMGRQAMPKTDRNTGKMFVERIKLRRTGAVGDADDPLVENELMGAFDLRTEIDQAFPFERLRTIYRYPSDLNELRDNQLPDDYFSVDPARNLNIEVEYGLLQKMYANMTPTNRKRWLEIIYDQVIPQIATFNGNSDEQFGLLPLYNNDVIPPQGPFGLYSIPSGNPAEQKPDELTEAVFVAVQATHAGGGISTDSVLKLPSEPKDFNNKDELQVVREGSEITIPGALALIAEAKNNHRLMSYETEGVYNDSTTDGYEGTEYLFYLTDASRRIDSAAGNEELVRTIQAITRAEYTGNIEILGDIVHLHIVDGNLIRTLILNRKSIEKGMTQTNLKKAPNFRESYNQDDENFGEFIRDGRTAQTVALLDGPRINFNANIRGVGPVLAAYVNEASLEVNRADRSGALEWNAIGMLYEHLMIQCAKKAQRSIEEMPTASQFDRMVASCIGTYEYPGLARSHALIHYQSLFHQLNSSIARSDAVDKERFVKGTVQAMLGYMQSPAKNAIYYMMNERGYINAGAFVGGRPSFFETPPDAARLDAKFNGLKNSFSVLAIGYYRLMMSQLRNRVVIQSERSKLRAAAGSTDIKKLWKWLIGDAESNPPEPKKFAMMLRFLAQARPGSKSVIKIPSWMPVEPEDMDEKDTSGIRIRDYLVWAYSDDPVNIEAFTEVAAAYHAAKAISWEKSYPKMVKRFVESVDDDMGHAFLFAILLQPEHPSTGPDQVVGTPVTVTNIAMDSVLVGQRVQPDEEDDEPAPPAPPAPPEEEVVELTREKMDELGLRIYLENEDGPLLWPETKLSMQTGFDQFTFEVEEIDIDPIGLDSNITFLNEDDGLRITLEMQELDGIFIVSRDELEEMGYMNIEVLEEEE